MEGAGKVVQLRAERIVHRGRVHSRNGSRAPYTAADFDFLVVYLMPEETLYILPVREAAERYSLRFRVATANRHHRRDPYAHYREAWHQLREPDGLTFG